MTRILLTAVGLVLALTGAARADKLSLGEISAYLNTITSAEADFTQINGDGTISTGDLAIKRPGKVRFDYDPPEKALVMASAGAVYVFDRGTGAQANTYPLSQTPLSIILDRNVDLTRAGMVVGHEYDGTATIVTAQDPARPEYGRIRLKFTDSPVELRQWVIEDGDGGSTTVALGGLRKTSLNNSLFDPQRAMR